MFTRVLVFAVLSFVVSGSSFLMQAARAQEDRIESDRRDRYVERLTELQKYRTVLQERATHLATQSPIMQEAVAQAMQRAMIAEGMLAQTREVLKVPNLFFSSGGLMQGRSDFVQRQPALIVWYALEDNTRWRSVLMAELANAQAVASVNIANLQSTMLAMKQIAAEADQNFLDFRKLADFMGRRGRLEIVGAEKFTAEWLKKEPLNAGAGLIQAYALRADGKLTESEALLDKLDDNYPPMQAIHESVAAQNAFLRSNLVDVDKHLDKAIAAAKGLPIAEPYLVAGWIAMAMGEHDKAHKYAHQAKAADSKNLECYLLESLVIAKQTPRKAKEALQLLRTGQQYATKDDWHYHEALALVHAVVGDKNYALRELDTALAAAPTFVRTHLKNQGASIKLGIVPDTDWTKRLRESWQRNESL